MVLEIVMWGFLSAFGWWGANHYVVDVYLEPKTKVEKDVNDK